MTERDYKSTPVSDSLGIRSVIDGLASDLQELRNGTISPIDAMARAHLAKQFFNGARLVLLAMKELPPPVPRTSQQSYDGRVIASAPTSPPPPKPRR